MSFLRIVQYFNDYYVIIIIRNVD